MKIVIDIDECSYRTVLENYQHGTTVSFATKLIANGTPLPKGHGDLIDRDVAYEVFDKACCSYEGGLLQYAPTVIPSDK